MAHALPSDTLLIATFTTSFYLQTAASNERETPYLSASLEPTFKKWKWGVFLSMSEVYLAFNSETTRNFDHNYRPFSRRVSSKLQTICDEEQRYSSYYIRA